MCISFEFPVKTTSVKEQMIAADHHAAGCTLLQNLKDDKKRALRVSSYDLVIDMCN